MLRLVLFSGLAASLPLAAQTFRSGPASVPLLELYTSEGCSSCPPADRWLSTLVESPRLWNDIVPVSFHVNYWDGLGWKDAFARPEFTVRQKAYAALWNARTIYTPAFVLNGREWNPGRSAEGDAPAGVLTVDRDADGALHVEFAPAGALAGGCVAHVALLGGGFESRVRAGENAGRVLGHDFVVTALHEFPLKPTSEGRFRGDLAPVPLPDAGRKAVAAWVSKSGSPVPLQAVGGWLP